MFRLFCLSELVAHYTIIMTQTLPNLRLLEFPNRICSSWLKNLMCANHNPDAVLLPWLVLKLFEYILHSLTSTQDLWLFLLISQKSHVYMQKFLGLGVCFGEFLFLFLLYHQADSLATRETYPVQVGWTPSKQATCSLSKGTAANEGTDRGARVGTCELLPKQAICSRPSLLPAPFHPLLSHKH